MIKTKVESTLVDVLDGCRWEEKIHEHGLVALVDVMPRLVPTGQTCDKTIVQAARVSYGERTKTINEDTGLIRYLMRHRHTTPYEMMEFKFHCVMPIFIARQWIRHRTAHVNEYSARYSIMKDRFYTPSIENVRKQSNTNKQGGSEPVKDIVATDFLNHLNEVQDKCYSEYEYAIEQGISREQARMLLPVNCYTEWYWKIDLHNLFHFLGLRMEKHAQQEIQDYSYAIFEMLKQLCPIACRAFMDYKLNSITLSGPEIACIKGAIVADTITNKREREEFEEKLVLLGLE